MLYSVYSIEKAFSCCEFIFVIILCPEERGFLRDRLDRLTLLTYFRGINVSSDTEKVIIIGDRGTSIVASLQND
jgi:hypothetical protein